MSNVLIQPDTGLISFDSDGYKSTKTAVDINPLSSSVAIAYNNYGGLNIVSLVDSASGNEKLSVDGTLGRLFTLSDILTGVLFSINDISGLPIFQVIDPDIVIAGEFKTNTFVLSGTTASFGRLPSKQYKVTITGGLSTDNLFVDVLSTKKITVESLTANDIKTNVLYPLSVQNFTLFDADMRTFVEPVTATGEFLILNINGKKRAIMLWDFNQPVDLMIGTLFSPPPDAFVGTLI